MKLSRDLNRKFESTFKVVLITLYKFKLMHDDKFIKFLLSIKSIYVVKLTILPIVM